MKGMKTERHDVRLNVSRLYTKQATAWKLGTKKCQRKVVKTVQSHRLVWMSLDTFVEDTQLWLDVYVLSHVI